MGPVSWAHFDWLSIEMDVILGPTVNFWLGPSLKTQFDWIADLGPKKGRMIGPKL